MRVFFVTTVSTIALALSVHLAAPADSAGAPSRIRTKHRPPDIQAQASFDGLNVTVWQRMTAYLAAVERNEAAARARAQAATAARRAPATSRSSGTPSVSGSCAAMKPAGFPDYIIRRESGGDPNAVNRSSGAMGCAQILPSHFRAGGSCAGMGYAECWSHLWAGGRGASNWACTPESGCG